MLFKKSILWLSPKKRSLGGCEAGADNYGILDSRLGLLSPKLYLSVLIYLETDRKDDREKT